MQLPDHVSKLESGESFNFRCHPGVSCFTECCRELELALTPYDCLRLRKYLGISSHAFLEQYVIVEKAEDEAFPQCYLTMVDDGRASCVFVGEQGCSVYSDRPGACRAYPLGRGVSLDPEGGIGERHVLLCEDHCRGFAEADQETAESYTLDQGLDAYNAFNDFILSVTQHLRIREGMRPDTTQLHQFMLALYNLDGFRKAITEDAVSMPWPADARQLAALAGDDEELLRLGVCWLRQQFFGEI